MGVYLTSVIALLQLLSSASADKASLSLNRGLFAADLLKHISHERSSENVIFSPVSIQTALAMVYMGAEGETAKELENGLRLVSSNKEEVGQGFSDLLKQRSGEALLNIANRVFYNSKYELKSDFNDRSKQYFNSEAEPLDVSDSLKAVNTVNSWIAKETRDKITNVIEPSSISPDTSAIIVNAIYFKGKWKSPFNKVNTRKSPFWISQDKSVDVDTMNVGSLFKYGDLPELDATALELSYKNSNLSMVLILPNQRNGLANLESKLSTVAINELASKLEPKRLELSLPKFKIEFKIELPDILKELGIQKIFGKPDLSGIFKSEGVSISDVTHKAFIDVNEAGSEAAAATVVSMARMGRIIFKDEFNVDHPFVFAIKDPETVYFVGHIARF